MLVSEMIAELKRLPQDRSVICQVVGQNSGAWNMDFCVRNISHSDWAVQLRVSHPNLTDLPMGEELFTKN